MDRQKDTKTHTHTHTHTHTQTQTQIAETHTHNHTQTVTHTDRNRYMKRQIEEQMHTISSFPISLLISSFSSVPSSLPFLPSFSSFSFPVISQLTDALFAAPKCIKEVKADFGAFLSFTFFAFFFLSSLLSSFP